MASRTLLIPDEEGSTVEHGLVAAITSFVTPETFPRFGLPAELEP